LDTLVLHRDKFRSTVTLASRQHVVFGLVGLLLAEVLILTFRFDSQAVVERGGWSGSLLARARYLPQALIVVAGAALVLGGSRLRAGLAASAEGSDGAWFGRTLAFLLAHLAAFLALTALTGAVWEGPLGRSPNATLWVAVWLATGLATLALWLAAVLPTGSWALAARRYSGVLLV
jgi:hypothetical protein